MKVYRVYAHGMAIDEARAQPGREIKAHGRRALYALVSVNVMIAAAPAHELDAELTSRFFTRVGGSDQELTDAGLRAQARYAYHAAGVDVYAEGRLRWNGVYLGDNPYSEEARDAYEVSFDWRELYLRFSALGFDWSAGWQQIVWGKADELRVLDQVNPVDLREFVLLDLDDYRKTVPAVRANRRFGEWDAELLYVARFRPTSFARSGSEFFIPQIDPALADRVSLLPDAEYDSIGAGSELGVRFTRSFEGLDLELVGFYTRDDLPVFRLEPLADTGSMLPGLRREHHRYFLAGTGIALPLGSSLVLRGELGYIPRKTFNADDTPDGLDHSGQLTGLIGLDYTYGDWLITAQALDQYILGWRPAYREERHTPTFTVTVQGTSLGARLDTRLFWAVQPLRGDGSWLQIRNTYRFDDHWAAALIVDLLQGRDSGFFGQFDDKDRIGVELSFRY